MPEGVRRSAPQGTLDACSVLSCGMTPHSTLDRPPWYCRGRFFVLRCRIRTPGLRIVRASGHQDFFEEMQTMANTPHPIRDRRALHNHLKLFFLIEDAEATCRAQYSQNQPRAPSAWVDPATVCISCPHLWSICDLRLGKSARQRLAQQLRR